MLSFVFFLVIGVVLLLSLVWVLHGPRKRGWRSLDALSLEESGRHHVAYLPQIRQSLSSVDLAFLSSTGSVELARRVRKERRRIASSYLPAIREDFEKMLCLARVVAALSPDIVAIQEWERLSLTAQFLWRYQLVRFGLLCGIAPIPQLNGLSQMVSRLAVRMETAMAVLGERAALAAELASSLDRGRIGTA